jgi:ParB-like chromosome segregation protein Spo0J
VTKAIEAYREVMVSTEFREVERLRADARHNEASALHHARVQRDVEIARKMVTDGESVEKIAKYTGLTRAEIENLRNAD